MVHKMSLAKITLKYKASIPNTIIYTWDTSASTATSGTAINVMASETFNTTSPYVTPYYSGTVSNQKVYYYVTKYNEKPQLRDADATEYKKWTSIITIQNSSSNALGQGNYAEFTATSRAESRNWCYYQANFPYRGKMQQFTVPIAGSYQFECWGAQGNAEFVGRTTGARGAVGTVEYSSTGITHGGWGAYCRGNLVCAKDAVFYAYVGQQGAATINTTSWNGG